MNGVNNYTEPRLVKGKEPKNIPKGSTKEKEWAKKPWYINYSFNGKQYRVKGDLNRIKDYKEKAYQGEVLLQSIKNDLKNGFDPTNPEAFLVKYTQETITLSDAVGKYLEDIKLYNRPKTVQSYHSKLRYLIEEYPNKQVQSFSINDIETYIRKKIHNTEPAKIFMNNKSVQLEKAIPWTHNTVRTAKGVFRAFFQWCINNNYYKGKNPSAKLESKKIRSEVEAKPRHVPFTRYTLYSFKHYTNIQRLNSGWSISEIMKANRHSSVSMTDKYLRQINRDTDISKKEVPAI